MGSTADSVAPATDDNQPPEGLAEYTDTLRSRLRDQQAAFDKAILFVAAGAFTVSAAFFPRLPDPLQWPGVLIAAWSAWAICVSAVLIGHVLSVEAHTRVLNLLSAGEYDPEVIMSDWRIRVISKLNRWEFAALLAGFVLFAVFTFTNLNFGGADGMQSGRAEQQGRLEEQSQQERRATESEEPAGSTERALDTDSGIRAAPALEAPAEAMKESNDDGDRKTAPAAAATAAPRPNAGSSPGEAVSTGASDSEEQSTGGR